MGYDAACTMHLDGRKTAGKAVLEQKDLVFRGEVRLAIPLAAITSARADGALLEIQFKPAEARGKTRTAGFELGSAAAKWAARISNPPSRLDKLGVKEGMSVLILGIEDEGFRREVESRGARLLQRRTSGGANLIFYGADRRESLDKLQDLAGAIVPDGGIWIVRPKGVRAISEADVMAAGKQAGLVDVKVVSFSETLTAEKFVIPVAKRAAPDHPSRSPRKS
jgi:hypothetical protein